MKGRRPVLTDMQLAYLLRAERIRARLSRKALAARWNVSLSVLSHAVSGLTNTLEEWEARSPPSMTKSAARCRAYRLRVKHKRAEPVCTTSS